MIRQAIQADFEAVTNLFRLGSAHQRTQGLDQWRYGIYPSDEILSDDISNGWLYLIVEGTGLQGAFAINQEHDPEYDAIAWLLGTNPLYMHRLVILPECQGQGLAARALQWIAQEGIRRGHDCLRLDAYSLNESAMRLYARFQMRKAGEIHLDGRSAPFICMEKQLVESCPLLPIPMSPAFRFGKDTPWGGSKLNTVLGKAITDDRTGESLEVSVLPHLNSTDPMGESLSELIAEYKEKLLGEDWDAPFPLLLKFIDAKEALSVQVHPDDAYAFAHENGKLGKEEAWVVLQADEGATLVYGTEPGITIADLREALQNGEAVETLMRKVPVKPLDVLFIPAGCIHAIGGGIMLYEIQQSSDVTYRLYDYGRMDKQGNKRELHIEKSLDVCDTSLTLEPIPAPETPGVTRVLDKRRFILDSALVQGELILEKAPTYALLTVMDDMDMIFENAVIHASKGQTYFLPATCPKITLRGHGRALISMPPKGE